MLHLHNSADKKLVFMYKNSMCSDWVVVTWRQSRMGGMKDTILEIECSGLWIK